MSNQAATNQGDDFLNFLGAGLVIALMVALIVVVIYGAIFGLVFVALYLGAKLGAMGGHHEPYHRVLEIENKKRHHLKQLEGESDELRDLVETQFEEQKLALYRPKDDTHQPPHKELALEFGKAAMKHFAAALFRRDA